MDADDAGRAFARALESIVNELSGYVFRLDLPPNEGDDWNDDARVEKPTPPASRDPTQLDGQGDDEHGDYDVTGRGNAKDGIRFARTVPQGTFY